MAENRWSGSKNFDLFEISFHGLFNGIGYNHTSGRPIFYHFRAWDRFLMGQEVGGMSQLLDFLKSSFLDTAIFDELPFLGMAGATVGRY